MQGYDVHVERVMTGWVVRVHRYRVEGGPLLTEFWQVVHVDAAAAWGDDDRQVLAEVIGAAVAKLSDELDVLAPMLADS